MHILGIETSCDETALSIIRVSTHDNTVTILGNTVHSQIEQHIPYGGVFPSLAKREHGRNIIPVLDKTLREAQLHTPRAIPQEFSRETLKKLDEYFSHDDELKNIFLEYIPRIEKPTLDYISVTYGPGLEPALWVGIQCAKALSYIWNIPLVPAHHMEGHILVSLIQEIHRDQKLFDMIDRRIMYPALALLLSGGHTQLIKIDTLGNYTIIGDTQDDAIGECFDKVARTLGLPYPGGPRISALATEARAKNLHSPKPLPRPMIHSQDYNFSFSGLKTAVKYLVDSLKKEKNQKDEAGTNDLSPEIIAGIARETEDAITEVIIEKTQRALMDHGIETLILGGGVIANIHIREALQTLADTHGVKLCLPHVHHATDNGLMIALAGYHGHEKALNPHTGEIENITATGTLLLGNRA